jgi:hypothetical protein
MEEELSWNIDPLKHYAAQLEHLQVPTEKERCGALRESRVAQNHDFRGHSSACQSRIEIVVQDGKGDFARGEPVGFTFGA